MARAILADPAPGDAQAAGAELNQALSIYEALGVQCLAPQVHVDLAAVVHALDDEITHDAELRTAHRLFLAVGAQGQAEEVAPLIASH